MDYATVVTEFDRIEAEIESLRTQQRELPKLISSEWIYCYSVGTKAIGTLHTRDQGVLGSAYPV